MKKIIIVVLLLALSISFYVIYNQYNAKNEEGKIYEIEGKVINVNNNKAEIKLEKKVANKEKIIFNSKYLKIDDVLKIKYEIREKEIKVLDYMAYDKDPKWKDIKYIIENKELKELQKNVFKAKNNKIFIIPSIMNHKIIETLTPMEFIKKYNHIYDGEIISTPKEQKIVLKFYYEWELIRITNIDNEKESKVDYEIKDSEIKATASYAVKTKEATLNSLGKGMYVAEFKLPNEDMIKVLFF